MYVHVVSLVHAIGWRIPEAYRIVLAISTTNDLKVVYYWYHVRINVYPMDGWVQQQKASFVYREGEPARIGLCVI